MSWATAVSELRALLSDGPTDRYHYRKRCFGEINGINTAFKTFEFRRVTDFTVTQGVFKNGIVLAASGVTSDDPSRGQFVLASSPQDGSIIEASYYTQWFIDSELQSFLTNASRWLTSGDDYTAISGGLIPPTLKYAAADAYQKMAERWRSFLSEGFKLEDAPKEGASSPVESLIKMSEQYRKDALESRDEFYTRQGRKLQPLFGSVRGRIRNLP